MLQDSATFFINPTTQIPFVEFNRSEGKLDIIGKQAPKSSPEFYEKLSSWIGECLKANGHSLSINISLEDCDISSNDNFSDLLKSLKTSEDKNEVSINWYYYGFKDQEKKSLVTQMDRLGISYNVYSYSV